MSHRRFEPVANSFRYRVYLTYLDLAELDTVFRGRWLWSMWRFAPAWFRRADHLGDPAVPLDGAVRDLVEGQTGRRPTGPIRLLTHLRSFGYEMNPVSFYYCFHPREPRLEAFVAEVNNTPWRERHCYAFDLSADQGTCHQRLFDKEFYVSPFMGMDQRYEWSFRPPGRRLVVHMKNREQDRVLFDATLSLVRREITGPRLARVLVGYPFLTGKVVAAIYWQALRLWWKGCPSYSKTAPSKV